MDNSRWDTPRKRPVSLNARVFQSLFFTFPPLSPFQCWNHVTVSSKRISILKRGWGVKLSTKKRFLKLRMDADRKRLFCKVELSCPLGTTRRVPQEKFPRKLYKKSFIGQACPVKMAGYRPRSFLWLWWTSTPPRSINTQKRKELGQYPAFLTSHLVNNPYVQSRAHSL